MNTSFEMLPCKNCQRLIESSRIQLHQLMCSTAHLRKSYRTKSKIFKRQKKQCQYCLQQFQQQEFDYHINLACKHRLVPCIDCDDMFPLSLFNQHLEVCRGNLANIEKNQDIKEENIAFNNLITGLGNFGCFIYGKGCQVAGYCNKFIEKNRAPALLYLQKLRTKIQDTFEDLFISLAYDQSVQGMPRNQIRKIPLTNFHQKQEIETCTICICQLQDEQSVKQLKCKHVYHPGCIDKWLRINRTCPLCKKDQMSQ